MKADWKKRVLGRRRPSSYNRNSTCLRAALNLALARSDVASDHASVVMIEKHYGHLRREHARSALDKLARA